ncbi:hypothetical protein A2476_02830 [candidate division CPR3 bacterium RIFOXYC2_FULL_35_7]|nr:MAG: hypothetical protein A2476_02830 [candidate division CPR3 bacterium RIFOXYC2_FULL_35_7]
MILGKEAIGLKNKDIQQMLDCFYQIAEIGYKMLEENTTKVYDEIGHNLNTTREGIKNRQPV